MDLDIRMRGLEMDTKMAYDGCAGQHVLAPVVICYPLGDTKRLILIEEGNVKIAPSHDEAPEEALYGIGGMQDLETWIEVDVWIVKALEQETVSLDQEQLVASIVANNVNASAV